MNIYLVLDASDSIGARNFTGAKDCLRDFIEKVKPLPLNVGTLNGSHCHARTSFQGVFPAPLSHRVLETSRASFPFT